MKKLIQIMIPLIMVFLSARIAVPATDNSESTHYVGITAKIGTLGPGADVTINLGPYFNFRGGFNWFTYERTVDFSEAEVDGEINWLTIPLLLDFHPAKSGFRISGGAILNNNEVLLSATPGEDLEFNGTTYEVARFDGDLSFDELSWYFGIGYGNAVGSDGRWHFFCDFGVMYHGEPEINVRAETALPAEYIAQFESDVQQEVDDLEEDLKPFVVYPVISLGVSFAF